MKKRILLITLMATGAHAGINIGADIGAAMVAPRLAVFGVDDGGDPYDQTVPKKRGRKTMADIGVNAGYRAMGEAFFMDFDLGYGYTVNQKKSINDFDFNQVQTSPFFDSGISDVSLDYKRTHDIYVGAAVGGRLSKHVLGAVGVNLHKTQFASRFRPDTNDLTLTADTSFQKKWLMGVEPHVKAEYICKKNLRYGVLAGYTKYRKFNTKIVYRDTAGGGNAENLSIRTHPTVIQARFYLKYDF